MARGAIRKHERSDGVRYEVVVDLGIDPITGKRRQRTRSFKAKKEAQAALTAWLAEINKGTVVDRSQQTVAEMMQYWLDSYAKHTVRPATYEGYTRIIRNHILPALGSVLVQKLTPDQLQTFYSDKLAAGFGPRTIQLCHLRLHQALTQAVKLGLVARNVAEFVTPPRSEHVEMKTWTAVQAKAFLAVAQAESAYGPIWLVALATGMRKGELLGLRWQDVDLDEGAVNVRKRWGSSRRSRILDHPKAEAHGAP